MDPVTQSIIGSRTLPPSGAFDHWQAAPLRITLMLASGVNISGAVSIVAEIRDSQTTSTDPLATLEHTVTDTDGPWTLDFTGPQANQPIAAGRPSRSLWLVIVATYPDDRIEILATRTITLHRHAYSGAVAAPPAAVLYLTTAQAAALYYTKAEVDALIAEGGGGGGGASLSTTRTSTTVTIVSDSGTDATIPAADASNAGVLTAADKTKLDGLDTALALKAPLASPVFTGVPEAPTAAANTNTTQIATTAFVLAQVSSAVAGLLDFKGDLNASASPNYPAASKGDTYYISAAGLVGGGAGKTVAVGDALIASADNAGGTEASVGSSWFILEKNLIGALIASNNLSDLANAGTARNNLGLGTAATANAGAGGNGVLDNGYIPFFGAAGDLAATKSLTISNPSITGAAVISAENITAGNKTQYLPDNAGTLATQEWATANLGGLSGTGSVDNAVLRANGTGGSSLQSSNVQIADSGQVFWPTGLGAITHIAGPTDQSLKVAATPPAQVSASGAGNALTLTGSNATAGSASGGAVGGALNITGGSGAGFTAGTAGQTGGAVTITGGPAGGSNDGSVGGAVNIVGGSGSTGTSTGGAINITSGSTAGGGTSGAVTIQSAGNASLASGTVSILTGNCTLNGRLAGSITIQPGYSAASNFNTPNSGSINLTTQVGGSNSQATGTGGFGGGVITTLGNGGAQSGATNGTGGAGGAWTVTGGTGGAATGTGGTHTGGAGTSISMTAGTGGAATSASGTRTGGAGGSVTLTSGPGGNGSTTNGASGNFILATGAPGAGGGAAGATGTIQIKPGGATQLEIKTDCIVAGKPVIFPPYTVATVPNVATYARGVIHITDEAGGPTLAQSDGTNWRRLYDNAIIS